MSTPTTIRLEPPLWLNTPRGDAYAIFMTDRGFDQNRVWTCVVQETGEIWDFENPDVRVPKNITYGVNCDNTYPKPWAGNRIPRSGAPATPPSDLPKYQKGGKVSPEPAKTTRKKVRRGVRAG